MWRWLFIPSSYKVCTRLCQKLLSNKNVRKKRPWQSGPTPAFGMHSPTKVLMRVPYCRIEARTWSKHWEERCQPVEENSYWLINLHFIWWILLIRPSAARPLIIFCHPNSHPDVNEGADLTACNSKFCFTGNWCTKTLEYLASINRLLQSNLFSFNRRRLCCSVTCRCMPFYIVCSSWTTFYLWW